MTTNLKDWRAYAAEAITDVPLDARVLDVDAHLEQAGEAFVIVEFSSGHMSAAAVDVDRWDAGVRDALEFHASLLMTVALEQRRALH